jgi:hypothetical protein
MDADDERFLVVTAVEDADAAALRAGHARNARESRDRGLAGGALKE